MWEHVFKNDLIQSVLSQFTAVNSSTIPGHNDLKFFIFSFHFHPKSPATGSQGKFFLGWWADGRGRGPTADKKERKNFPFVMPGKSCSICRTTSLYCYCDWSFYLCLLKDNFNANLYMANMQFFNMHLLSSTNSRKARFNCYSHFLISLPVHQTYANNS